MVAEVLAHDLPRGHEILSLIRRDVDGCLHDITELRSGGAERSIEVLHHLLCLPREIASRHDVSLRVERTGARTEHQGCIAFHDCRIGVRDFASEVIGAHEPDSRIGHPSEAIERPPRTVPRA